MRVGAYRRWVARYDTLTETDCRAIERDIEASAERPVFSVILSLVGTVPRLAEATLTSVTAQLWPDWELCVATGPTPPLELSTMLAEFAARDRRIRPVMVGDYDDDRVAAAANEAIAASSGAFILLLAPGDRLPRHALYLVAREIRAHPDAGLIYGDEDTIDAAGRRFAPHFKSDWNPDLLLAQGCCDRSALYRTALLREAGGLRPEYDEAAAYDLTLRLSRRLSPERIRHIPHVLYHRSAALVSGTETDREHEAARRAAADHVAAVGRPVTIEPALHGMGRHIVYALPHEPKVSIIIPTRDRIDLLQRCVSGLLERTEYENFEILIVDNGSVERQSLAYLEAVAAQPRVRVLPYAHPFNYSRINNWAAAQANGEVLLFLNNDTEVIGRQWLRVMAANAMRPEVGAVGAKLLYPNGLVQHAGVVLGLGGVGHHIYRERRADFPGYFGRAVLQQNLSAVTAACMAMRRDVFAAVGGFDESLRVAFNDVDLCLRVRAQAYLIVWTPQALLYHHESASRPADLMGDRHAEFTRENAFMLARWGAVLARDPYFNPNLRLAGWSVGLAFPPRKPYPWRSDPADVSR